MMSTIGEADMPQGKYRNPMYPLRIDSELMAKLKYIANESSRSANKEIEQLIIKHVKEYEADFGVITSKDIAHLFD